MTTIIDFKKFIITTAKIDGITDSLGVAELIQLKRGLLYGTPDCKNTRYLDHLAAWLAQNKKSGGVPRPTDFTN